MIKRILLENYMSHARTEIEPAAGLTVLVGPNNCGKSAVVSALETLCYNRNGDFMVRHGQKEAAVTVETDDGHVLTWKRRGTTVLYVIDGREVFRLQGKTPDDLHEHLKLPRVSSDAGGDEFDIHFGTQKSPIFLLNEPESRAATFFASSSDAEKLLEMQRRHREQTADAKKDQKRLTAELAETDAKLATLSPLEALAPQVTAIEEEHTAVCAATAKAEALAVALRVRQDAMRRAALCAAQAEASRALLRAPELNEVAPLEMLARRLRHSEARAELGAARHEALQPLAVPPTLGDEAGLQKLVRNIAGYTRRRTWIVAALAVVDSLRPAPETIDTAEVVALIEKLRRAVRTRAAAAARVKAVAALPAPPEPGDPAPLESLIKRVYVARSEAAQRATEIDRIDKDVVRLKAAAAAWARENPVCPVCNGITDADRLLTGPAHVHAPTTTDAPGFPPPPVRRGRVGVGVLAVGTRTGSDDDRAEPPPYPSPGVPEAGTDGRGGNGHG